MRLIPLDTVVRNMSGAYGIDASKYYVRLIRLVKMTLSDFNLIILDSVKTVELEVGENLTAAVPDDCIEILKVGRGAEDGCIGIMQPKSSVGMRIEKNDCSCSEDDVSPHRTEGCNYCAFYNYYDSGYYSTLYGVNNQAHYGCYDYRDGQLFIDSSVGVGGKILVSYKSTVSGDKSSLVPVEIEQMLTFRVMQLFYMNQNSSISLNFERQFKAARDNYKTLKSPTISEHYASIKTAYLYAAR